jgi:hypothetical protein
MGDDMEAQTKPTQAVQESPVKRPYHKPELIEYGSVLEFTRGPGGKSPDSKIGGHA